MTDALNRRRFLRLAGGTLLAAAGGRLGLLGAPEARGATSPRRPNIIYILADDLGYGDLSVQGQKHFSTPRLDAMAAQGLRFTQHYAGSTVCAPSRACLLTGQHTGHVSMRGNGPYALRPDPDDMTIARLLKTAGYHTAMIGKSSVACNSDDPALPQSKGFDHFFGFLGHSDAHRHYPEYLWRNGEKVELAGNRGQEGEQYANELFAREAEQHIERRQDGPFFLHLSFTLPHADLAAPDEYRRPFLGRFEEKLSANRFYRAEPAPLATYAAMVTFLDAAVGRILDKLKALGIERDTLVLFASDNGPHSEGGYHYNYHQSNGSLRGGKRDLYEGGIRVPHLAWWPGTVRSGVSDHLSAFWDFVPTACELAGAQPPANIDGISYAPTLLGEADRQRAHEALYWEFHGRGGSQAVRRGRWKAIRKPVDARLNGPIELYDLETDPGEQTDVADQHPQIVAEMDRLLRANHTPSDTFRFGPAPRR